MSRDPDTVTIGGRAVPAGLVHLAAGIPLALLFHWLLCGTFAMGVRILFHESGHALLGWFFGHPSIPSAIGATRAFEQETLLVLAVFAGLLAGAWSLRRHRPFAIALAAAAVLQLGLAWTRAHWIVIWLMGHGGEVLFACFFLWRTLQGGWKSEGERTISAMFAWYLWVGNLTLFFGLWTDDKARVVYRSISKTGADNDFVKVADALGWQLETTAALMLVFALAAPIATLALWTRVGRARRESDAG